MKRLTLFALLLVLGCVGAFAQAPAATTPAAPAATAPKPAAPAVPPVPGKTLGTIDFLQVVTESAPGKALQSTYEKEMKPFADKLEQLRKDITDLQTKLQAAKTDAEKASISRDIDAKNREGQRVQEDYQRADQDIKDRHLGPIAAMVNTAVDEYSKSHGLALVLDPTTDPTNIVYRDAAMDITNEIMRMVNAAYAKDPKLAAPLAPGAAPAAPPKN